MHSSEVVAVGGPRRRVMLLDAFPVVRHGLGQALAAEPDLEVVAAASDPAEALAVASDVAPDAIVSELNFPEAGGLELVRALRSACPGAAILVFSGHDPATYAERTLRAGASGYVSKREQLPDVLRALRRVLGGGVHVGGGDATDRAAQGSEPEGARLTDRELQVLEHLGRGLRSREIAGAMGLSEKTIEGYRAQLRAKLGLRDAATLLQHAIRWVKLHQS